MRGPVLDIWSLPESLQVGQRQIPIRADFRDVFKALGAFSEELPCFFKWCKALRLFYKEPVGPAERQAAAEAMVDFLNCGREQKPGRRLICWQHDGALIASEVNRVAGLEVRQLPFVHWWTFLGWFHAIGDGPLAQIVAIRASLAAGRPLSDSQQAFYREHRAQVRLPDAPEVQREKQQLELLLKGGSNGDQNFRISGSDL